MLTVTIRGQCPHCKHAISCSTNALTDREPLRLPIVGDMVMVGKTLSYIAEAPPPERTAAGNRVTFLAITIQEPPAEEPANAGLCEHCQAPPRG